MVAKCFYLSRNLLPSFGYGKLKVSVNENFSRLLDFVFFWIFGMSGS